MVERFLGVEEVASSNLVVPTILRLKEPSGSRRLFFLLAKEKDSRLTEALWKDWVDVKKTILLCLLCLVLLSSVGRAAMPIPGELREGSTPVKLGDPIEKVLGFFGRPTRIAANGENYCWRDWLNLYGAELIIKTKFGNKTMWCIVVDRVPMVRTPEGIGIGSSKEEIEAVYGEGKSYVSTNGDIVLSYGGEKARDPFLRFRLSGKKKKATVYMILGNPGIGAPAKGQRK